MRIRLIPQDTTKPTITIVIKSIEPPTIRVELDNLLKRLKGMLLLMSDYEMEVDDE